MKDNRIMASDQGCGTVQCLLLLSKNKKVVLYIVKIQLYYSINIDGCCSLDFGISSDVCKVIKDLENVRFIGKFDTFFMERDV